MIYFPVPGVCMHAICWYHFENTHVSILLCKIATTYWIDIWFSATNGNCLFECYK